MEGQLLTETEISRLWSAAATSVVGQRQCASPVLFAQRLRALARMFRHDLALPEAWMSDACAYVHANRAIGPATALALHARRLRPVYRSG